MPNTQINLYCWIRYFICSVGILLHHNISSFYKQKAQVSTCFCVHWTRLYRNRFLNSKATPWFPIPLPGVPEGKHTWEKKSKKFKPKNLTSLTNQFKVYHLCNLSPCLNQSVLLISSRTTTPSQVCISIPSQFGWSLCNNSPRFEQGLW